MLVQNFQELHPFLTNRPLRSLKAYPSQFLKQSKEMSNKFVDKPGLDRCSVTVKGHSVSTVKQKKTEFVCSFFGRIVGLKNSLRLRLTFSMKNGLVIFGQKLTNLANVCCVG